MKLDVKGDIRRICVGRCQKVGEKVVFCCVREELESIDRRIKRALVSAAKGEGYEKPCQEMRKESKEGRGERRACVAM